MNGCPVSGSHQTQLIPSSCQQVGTNMSRYWSILLSSVAKILLSPVMSNIGYLELLVLSNLELILRREFGVRMPL